MVLPLQATWELPKNTGVKRSMTQQQSVAQKKKEANWKRRISSQSFWCEVQRPRQCSAQGSQAGGREVDNIDILVI